MKRLALAVVIVIAAAPLFAAVDLAQLGADYAAMDYDALLRDADLYIAAHPDSVEARAWRISAARWVLNATYKDDAEWLTRTHPDDPWSWYAASLVRADGDPTALIDKAIALSPSHNTDFILERVYALRNAQREADSMQYLDEQLRVASDDARLLGAKASILAARSWDESRALYEKALTIDPNNVRVLRNYADDLRRHRLPDEAFKRIAQAERNAPLSLFVLHYYWSAVQMRSDLNDDERNALIDDRIDALIRVRGDWPNVLFTVANYLRETHREDEAKAFEERVAAIAPMSRGAEMIDFFRMQKSRSDVAAIGTFIDRPCHDDRQLLAEANMYLFVAARDTLSDDELRKVIPVMQESDANQHITYILAATTLADRGIDLDAAMRMVDRAETLMGDNPLIPDARGWIELKQHRLVEAQRDLENARNLMPQHRAAHYHLGQLFETLGRTTAAAREYAAGLHGLDEDPRPEAALKALYKKQQPSMKGFDAYVASLSKETDGDRRKRVLAERIAKARVAPSFKLKTLDGKSVSLDDLKGKVAVVNFWGVWCGWCVREMPEFQKLAAKYAHDAHVRVLTIDNDQNPEQVRKFMRDKKYTFAVLLDDGFVGKNSITSFPTTWFLDKQGRIAFDKRGASDKLLEEFSWRVEALRQ